MEVGLGGPSEVQVVEELLLEPPLLDVAALCIG